MSSADTFLLFELMTSSEKQEVKELLDRSSSNSLGTFYVKTAVLKIICEFFNKMKGQDLLKAHSMPVHALMCEVEKYLIRQSAGKLPNLKELGKRFSISESTLKRHFKKRFGVTISTYFTEKKMQRGLLVEHNK